MRRTPAERLKAANLDLPDLVLARLYGVSPGSVTRARKAAGGPKPRWIWIRERHLDTPAFAAAMAQEKAKAEAGRGKGWT